MQQMKTTIGEEYSCSIELIGYMSITIQFGFEVVSDAINYFLSNAEGL